MVDSQSPSDDGTLDPLIESDEVLRRLIDYDEELAAGLTDSIAEEDTLEPLQPAERQKVAEIAEEVLPERRDRINPRVIKRKMSNWKKKRPEHRHYPQPTKGFAEAIVMRR